MTREQFIALQLANYRKAINAGDRQAAIEIAEYANDNGGQFDDCPTMFNRAIPWSIV